MILHSKFCLFCFGLVEKLFCFGEKESRESLKEVKVITWELQHRLVVVDVKKENLYERIKIKTKHVMEGTEIKRKNKKKI